MDKETKDNIKKIKSDIKGRKLSKEEKVDYYNNIYHLYGAKIYDIVTPESIKKQDVKDLLKRGKFDDIYFKHGKLTYRLNLDYMKSRDIEYETGKKHLGVLNRIGNFVKKKIVAPLLGMSMALPLPVAAGVTNYAENIKAEERKLYSEQIQEYIANTEEYADSVSNMHLSQIETLMKVTDDMWKNIKGYGKPKIDLNSYPGLALATHDGVGVCRNMADDIARKLNSIDENYNARILSVYVEGEGYRIANIEFKIVEENNEESVEEATQNQVFSDESLDKLKKYAGNHKVVILDSIEEDATLVLDPTNPGMGVIKDGKITMFNSVGENKITFKVTPIIDFIQNDDRFELVAALLETYKRTDLSLEQLQEKYGIEEQNKALESVREREKTFKEKLVIKLDNNAILEFNNENQVEKAEGKEIY